jgi:hypothetical protein
MPIGRAQIAKEVEGKLRGARPSRAMLKSKKKRRNNG